MAFTREYEITHPAGSEDISQGDNRIRNLKFDFEERLEDMLYGFNADDGTGDEATFGVKKFVFKEQDSIATPSADQITLAAKESGNSKAELYVKDEDGDEFQITTDGKLGGSNIQLTVGKDLLGSATSDININDKFTVAGATGNTSVGGTFESVGVATLADASVTKTTAAPGADAQIANKKYVDAQRIVSGVSNSALAYDSVSWAACSIADTKTHTHNLGTKQILVQVLFSESSNGANASVIWFSHDGTEEVGAVVSDLSNTQLTVQFASDGVFRDLGSNGVLGGLITSGYYRVIALRIAAP